ncbi:hypothetical protein [Novosphingobium sp.]|uniref:hypothetical protein n=1 Tax=Novosphingobium sp. TaxID=1874826 RepID=UPI00286AE7CF|nr:hypothetical protein [Novosphingobium sp.]
MLVVVFVVLFVLPLVLLLPLFYHRMIAVRDGTQSRLETDPEPVPTFTPYVDEVRGQDGLIYAKSMDFDPSLSSADKRAAELPDINQTLQGKR